MKNKVETLFGDNKFILAMLHLKGENDRDVLENAKKEITIYQQNGVDAVIVENYFGTPAQVESVLHYLDSRELSRGLPGLADLCGGVAFIEVFAKEDAAIGDEDEFRARPARFYRRKLAEAGFVQIGSHGWLSPRLATQATTLERA